MESYNHVEIEGYVRTQPTVKIGRNGKPATTFAFATYNHNKSTGKDERETWIVRTFISKDFIYTLEKGDSIVISGRMRNRHIRDNKFDCFIQAEKLFIKK